MKRFFVVALLLGGVANASPLDTLISALSAVCSVSVPTPVLDQLGGASVQKSLCTLKDLG